jgi:hypothetical protein
MRHRGRPMFNPGLAALWFELPTASSKKSRKLVVGDVNQRYKVQQAKIKSY